MIENCIGVLNIPLGVSTNFKINNKDYIIPMAIEEPSVIAACSRGAQLICNSGDGFISDGVKNIMTGQIFIINNMKYNINNI